MQSISLVFAYLFHRYQVERRIFEELLELKRMQIRAGRANEQVLVKRLSDKYSKELQSTMGLKSHDGPYTFKEFEKYLYSEYSRNINQIAIYCQQFGD